MTLRFDKLMGGSNDWVLQSDGRRVNDSLRQVDDSALQENVIARTDECFSLSGPARFRQVDYSALPADGGPADGCKDATGVRYSPARKLRSNEDGTVRRERYGGCTLTL